MLSVWHGLEKQLTDRRFPWTAAAVIGCAAAAAYANALGAGLLYDSIAIIANDPRITELSGAHLRDILLGGYWYDRGLNLYRPLTTLSYAVHYSLLGNGVSATGYIAVNILIHAANSVLVAVLGGKLGLGRAAALVVGVVFAVHPLNTEAVTNVVGRADLLAAFGVLGGLLLHRRLMGRSDRAMATKLGVAAASMLAIGSKESGIVLIGVLVLHDLLWGRGDRTADATSGRRWIRRVTRSYLWCLAPVGLWFVMRAIAVGDASSGVATGDNPLLLTDAVSARLTAVGVLWRYVGLLVWPAGLSADYSFNAIAVAGQDTTAWQVALLWTGAVALLAVGLLAVVIRRRATPVAFGLGLFAIAISPVSNLLILIGTIMAERLMYLPGVGLLLAAGWACERVVMRAGGRGVTPRVAVAVALLVAVGLTLRTIDRNRDWSSGTRLFAAAVEVNPSSARAHKMLARQLFIETKLDPVDTHEQMVRVLHHADTAWQIAQAGPPDVGHAPVLSDLSEYAYAMADLSDAGEQAAWLAQAAEHCRAAIAAEQPTIKVGWPVRLRLARCLDRLNRMEEALAAYADALRWAPGPQVLEPYATALWRTDQRRASVIAALRLVTLQPEHAGMWRIVQRYYAETCPDETTAVKIEGRWVLNTRHPVVGADLQEAAGQQYRAVRQLDAGAGENYRRAVRAMFRLDPADGQP